LLEDAFLFEPSDRLAHRRAADPDLAGQRKLGDDVAGGQFPGEELAVDVLVGLVAKGIGGHGRGVKSGEECLCHPAGIPAG
jgi:hypothetical protein